MSEPPVFRIEVHHTTHIDRIPVEVLDAQIAEWRAKPWWFRLIRRSPLVRIGSKVDIRPEPLEGTFDTLEEADAAARARARDLAGEIRPDSAVVVLRDDGGTDRVVGGWYAGGESRV